MTIQKFIKCTPLKSDGQTSNLVLELKLKVSNKAGNYLLHRDFLRHLASKKQGTVSTKTRREVRGGGRKPWQQKGTGRARAGSNRSPLWKGGGVIFGPKPQTKSVKLNKKERKLALQTLLYNKKDAIVTVEDLETMLLESKTKDFLKICANCKIPLNRRLLIVVSNKTAPLKLATKNLKNVELINAKNLNTFSLLKADQLLLTLAAISDIKETYCE